MTLRSTIIRITLITLTATATAAALLYPTAADAAGTGFTNVLRLNQHDRVQLQQRVDQEMKAIPGGTQISQFEVAWQHGAVVLALPAPGRKGAAPSTAAALGTPDAVNVRAGAKFTNGAPASQDIVTPAGSSNTCPYSISSKWYCWYTSSNFDGARFQFSYNYCPGSSNGPQVNFADYGRDNQASSWVNNSGYSIHVWDLANAGGAQLWVEGSVSNSPYVGDLNNKRASSFRTCYS